MKKHLDLGCGNNPRNPYMAEELFGVDIMANSSSTDFLYQKVNLATENLPFKDSFFSSISAFDLLEHIPRFRMHEDNTTSFPFINLMNEVFRTLDNKGRFFAVTPYYPKVEAFQDPTHVNFIATNTHTYFCGSNCYGKNYGFIGNFRCIHSRPISIKLAKQGAYPTRLQKIYDFKRKIFGKQNHLLWELEAIKN